MSRCPPSLGTAALVEAVGVTEGVEVSRYAVWSVSDRVLDKAIELEKVSGVDVSRYAAESVLEVLDCPVDVVVL